MKDKRIEKWIFALLWLVLLAPIEALIYALWRSGGTSHAALFCGFAVLGPAIVLTFQFFRRNSRAVLWFYIWSAFFIASATASCFGFSYYAAGKMGLAAVWLAVGILPLTAITVYLMACLRDPFQLPEGRKK